VSKNTVRGNATKVLVKSLLQKKVYKLARTLKETNDPRKNVKNRGYGKKEKRIIYEPR
jgi:hypothetical protein